MLGLDAGDSSMDGGLSVGRVKVSEQAPLKKQVNGV
jgi:hypothetical protein